MATAQELKARACAQIERRKDEIVAISDHIMQHPEPGYREVRTAEFVASWFGRMGPKLSREEYLGLVRRFGSFEEYPGG